MVEVNEGPVQTDADAENAQPDAQASSEPEGTPQPSKVARSVLSPTVQPRPSTTLSQ